MKKQICIIILLFTCRICNAQNLVPNPSFEDTVTCPSGNLSNAVGWDAFRLSPDYFHPCNNSSIASFGVPSNSFGSQSARTGNAYIGVRCFNATASDDREYAGTQLSQPLIIGVKYFASFYASRGSRTIASVNAGINKVGMRLSTGSFSSINNPMPIDNYAQVYISTIISDTINWIKISGSFIADSACQYLSLGVFFTDSATSHVTYSSGLTAYAAIALRL